MKNKKRLVLLLVLALVLLAGAAGGGYAYWAGSVAAPTSVDKNGQTINIGTAKGVITTLTVGDPAATTNVLVPAGQAVNSNESNAVDSITLTFVVAWTQTLANGTAGTLAVTPDNVKINGAATHASLVNISIAGAGEISIGGPTVNVEVTITLTEPADATVYAAVASKAITFDLKFAVTLA